MMDRGMAEQAIRRIAAGHPVTCAILDRWAAIDLPDVWLSGSLLAQAHWNAVFGLPSLHGIVDADIIYFDADDLSEATEQAVSERVNGIFADLSIRIDVKNEARVHLWYGDRFGREIHPYRSSVDATLTFPTTASAVAIRPDALSAPFGLDDLLHPLVRGNAAQINQAYYEAKARRWASFWPDLIILPWGQAVRPPKEFAALQ